MSNVSTSQRGPSARERYARQQDRRAVEESANRESQGQTTISLQQQKEKTATEMLKQACRDANASVDVGENTTQKLRAQGEQMDGMSHKLDEIEYELKVSDRIVKSMSSWGGMVSSWFTSTPKAPKSSAHSGGTSTPTTTTSNRNGGSSVRSGGSSRGGAVPEAVAMKSLGSNNGSGSSGNTNSTTTAAPPIGMSAEDDALLDNLANNLHIMRNQAHLQREVLDEQNRKLDALANKNDKVHAHMQKTDRKVRQML